MATAPFASLNRAVAGSPPFRRRRRGHDSHQSAQDPPPPRSPRPRPCRAPHRDAGVVGLRRSSAHRPAGLRPVLAVDQALPVSARGVPGIRRRRPGDGRRRHLDLQDPGRRRAHAEGLLAVPRGRRGVRRHCRRRRTAVLHRRLSLHMGRRTIRPQPAHDTFRAPAPHVARILRTPPTRRSHVATLRRRQRHRATRAVRRHATRRPQPEDCDIRRPVVLPELETHARVADRGPALRCRVPPFLHAHQGGLAGEAPPHRHDLGRRRGEPEQRRARPGLRPPGRRDPALPQGEPRRVRRPDDGHAATGDVRPVHRPARDRGRTPGRRFGRSGSSPRAR